MTGSARLAGVSDAAVRVHVALSLPDAPTDPVEPFLAHLPPEARAAVERIRDLPPAASIAAAARLWLGLPDAAGDGDGAA